MADTEIVVLQHHMTDQTLVVPLAVYRQGARSKYRHWRIKGQARFIDPPVIPSCNTTDALTPDKN